MASGDVETLHWLPQVQAYFHLGSLLPGLPVTATLSRGVQGRGLYSTGAWNPSSQEVGLARCVSGE